jgi:intein-encoded DNA endonuclease-like protein
MFLYYQNIITNMTKAGRKSSIGKDIKGYIINAHNKGYSVRDIAKYLKEEKNIDISKTTVQRVISEHKTSTGAIVRTNAINEVKKVPVQKPAPVKNIFNVNKKNDEHKQEVVKKVKPPITDRIYTDYMETLEEANFLKELRIRYSYIAKKNSMSFKQFVQNACELERQYLDEEISITGGRRITEPDAKQILEMVIIGKAIKRL